LIQLSAHVPPPYKIHDRGTDQYGYVAFDANYYWAPGTARDEVKVLQYSNHIKIYLARQCIAEYPLPADGVKNELFPKGHPAPSRKPKNRKKPTAKQEKQLRDMAESVDKYMDFILKTKGMQHHQFIRKLDLLSRKMTPDLFIKSIERAHKYKITSIDVIGRIALLGLGQDDADLPLAEIDQDFYRREAYQEGILTEQPDLSIYEDTSEEDDDSQEE